MSCSPVAAPIGFSLITCGGDYDVDAGGYQQNLVVTAVPAEAVPARSSQLDRTSPSRPSTTPT
jgi:hypothetical protein